MTRDRSRRPAVLVADDHKVVAEGLAGSLAAYFTVVGQVSALDELVYTIQKTQPDVVVLDLTFAGQNSLPVMGAALKRGEVACRFVVLTAHESVALERAAIKAGASAFLLKGVGTQELRFAVEAAMEGRWYGPGALRTSFREKGDRGLATPLLAIEGVHLRLRQVEVLLLAHDGLSRQAIAERLDLTQRGVDFHLRVAKRAIGISDLKLLVRWVGENRATLEHAVGEGLDL